MSSLHFTSGLGGGSQAALSLLWTIFLGLLVNLGGLKRESNMGLAVSRETQRRAQSLQNWRTQVLAGAL